jgi:hypothetical protein
MFNIYVEIPEGNSIYMFFHILTASNRETACRDMNRLDPTYPVQLYAKIELQKSQHWFWEIYINPKIFDRQRMVSPCFLYIFSTEYQSDEANTLLQHLSVLFEAPVGWVQCWGTDDMSVHPNVGCWFNMGIKQQH